MMEALTAVLVTLSKVSAVVLTVLMVWEIKFKGVSLRMKWIDLKDDVVFFWKNNIKNNRWF